MKKSILTLVTITSLSFGAMAQTLGTGTSTTNIRGAEINIGADGSNDKTTIAGYKTTIKTSNTYINSPGEVKINTSTLTLTGSQVVTGNQRVNGYATFGQTAIFNGGATMNGTKLTGIRADYSDGNSAVNVNQLFTVRDNLRSETNLVQSNLNATNLRVTATEGDIVNLQNTKADKTDLVALDNKVNTEVNRLDGRIDALDTKVTSEISRVDSRIDATNTTVSNLTSTVEANKVEAKNYTDSKVGALENKMTSEFKRVDTKIETEVNRLDSKIDRNDAEIRRDLRTETDRLTRADAQLFAEMSGLGATMMAMGSMQSSAVYSPTKKGNVSFGSGVYRDSFAYAASVSYYVNPNTRISSTVAGGTKTKVGGGLGVSFGF
jgi:hypothetical protein